MHRFVWFFGILLAAGVVLAEDAPLVSGNINIFGSRISVSPSLIETPAGVPVFINTTGQGMTGILVGELRGPGINGVSFQTAPGQPFQLPPLPTNGNYSFEDIRLMRGDEVIAASVPDRVEIHVIEVLVTQISSRPLSLEEIRSLGIVINESDYTAVRFEVGLSFNSQQVQINLPLLLPKRPGLQPLIPPPVRSVGFLGPMPPDLGGLPPALPNFVPVTLSPDGSEDFGLSLPDIPGVIIFPNDIAFLNQFFSLLVMVRNNASDGSALSVDGLTSQIVIDPNDVRLRETHPVVPLGSPVPVRLPGADGQIGTADDIDLVLAGQTAQSEFFVEGLTEGTHVVRMNLHGTLHGLVQGDVPLSGIATGSILVRNPNFSITFSHPSVVRAHEEYDLFITVTNTSNVDANLVRLSMPANALVNCVLRSEAFQAFDRIAPGESATAKFHIEPLITGQVNSAIFIGSDAVHGQFIFHVGVGEQGIPLSPDTLVLPESANTLGNEFVERGLSVLGLAYSAATAPPGGLPPSLPYINKNAVFVRAVEMAQAGQRFQLGESRVDTLSHLMLDWLGNTTPDDGFDQIRRTTQKGVLFFDEIFSEMNVGANNALQFHHDFASSTFFRNPYVSAMLQSSNGSAQLEISDSQGRVLSATNSGIPGAALLQSEDGGAEWGLVGHPADDESYAIHFVGSGDSNGFSLIVPISGVLYRAEFGTFATTPGISYELLINPDSLANPPLQIKDVTGAVVASTGLMPLGTIPPLVISTMQDAKADKTGHILALLFNQPISENDAENIGNYSIDGNSAIAAELQPGGRIVYLIFSNPISPLIENQLKVTGFLTQNIQIKTTVSTDAGRVTGRLLGSDGVPIPFALVQLMETDPDDLLGEPTPHVTAQTTTNASGEFNFEYVRITGYTFNVNAQDPATGDLGTSTSRITLPNQFIHLDVILLGRGSVRGQVFQIVNGARQAVTNARVSGISLIEPGEHSVLTDEQGHYLLTGMAVGNVNLAAQNRDLSSPQPFFGATSTNIPSAGAVVSADIQVIQRAAASVTGRVLQSDGIIPIPNAYVVLSTSVGGQAPLQLSAFTDEDGGYSFGAVPAGLVSITATDSANGRIIGAASVNLNPGQAAVVNIVSQGAGSIEAFVIPASGMSLSDIGVLVQGTALIQDPVLSSPVTFQPVAVGRWIVLAYNRVTGETVSATADVPYASAVGGVSLRFPEKGSVQGTVVLVDGATPASGATVILFNGLVQSHLVATSVADGNGHFVFDDVDYDQYTVHAIAADHNDGGSSQKVTVNSGNRNATANITFIGKGTINVHVETSGGPAVVPVRLETITFDTDGRIRRPIAITHTTGTDGNVSFPSVFRGNFRIVVTTPLTVPAIVSGVLNGSSTQVNVLLSDFPEISGVVHDADGHPVQSLVTYTADSRPPQSVTTNPEGQFTFTNVAPGKGTFVAAAGGTLGEVEVYIQQSNPDIDIHLLGFGSVSGMLKDASGNPAPNTSLKLIVRGLLPRELNTTTDGNGGYRFENIPEGAFSIEASNGATGGRAGSSIIHNAEITLDILLSPIGTVNGFVYQFDGTTPVSTAEVKLLRSGVIVGQATSDSTGSFQFQSVPIGSYSLAALDKNSGLRGASSTFALASDGQSVSQNIVMEGQGIVSGVVYDFTGVNPVAGARITLQSDGAVPRILQGASDPDGNFAFPSVPTGPFAITAISGLLVGQTDGTVNNGADVTADVLLEPSASIDGSVLFFDHSSLPSDVVPIVMLTGHGVDRRIDAPGGVFSESNLPVQSYTLTTRFSFNGTPYRGIAQIDLLSPEPTNLSLILKGLKTVNVSINGSLLPVTTVSLTFNNDMERVTESRVIGTPNISFQYIPDSSFAVTVRTQDEGSGSLLSGSFSGQIIGDGAPPVQATINLTPSGTVTGVVFDPNSLPAADVSITLTSGTTQLFAITDPSGHFRLDGVPVGNYVLAATDDFHGGKARVRSSLVAGESQNQTLILDNILPQIVSVAPGSQTTGIPIDSTINIVFSESMDAATIQSSFALTTSGGTVQGTLSMNGAQAIFTPSSPLLPQRTYTVTVGTQAQDVAGNSLPASLISTFTTIDTVPPVLTNSLPINMAFNVPVNTQLTLFFNETIADRGSFVFTRNPAGTPITIASESWNATRTSVVMTFAAPFVQNERITFTDNNFKDSSGNTNSATIFFDTIDSIPPSAPSLTPSANPIREGTTVTITASIGEPLVNVDFLVHGVLRFHDTIPPFVYIVPASLTTIAANGGTQMMVEAIATDRSGNSSAKTALPIALIPDSPPQISIDTTPPAGNVQQGGVIHVHFVDSDDGRVTQVLILVTGAVNQTISAGNAGSGTRDVTLPADIPTGSGVTIQARATDDSGKSTITAPIQFTVAIDAEPPVVSLLLPDPALIYKTSQTLLARATATDNARVDKVEFYISYLDAQGQAINQLAGTDTTANGTLFDINFDFPRTDEIQIFARAIDPSGNQTDSALRLLHAVLNQLPVVSITDPAAGSSVIQGTTITLRANASDPDGHVSKVEFYSVRNSVTTLIGTDTTGPGYSVNYLVPMAAAAYPLEIHATAYDDLGDTTTDTVSVSAIPDPLSTVHGRVLDINGNPVVSATTRLFIGSSQAATVTTDSAGEYSFANQATISGNYVIKVTSGADSGETIPVHPTTPTTEMPDIVLRALSVRTYSGLTSTSVTAVSWYDTGAEVSDREVHFDSAWRFGVLASAGNSGNAKHIHLSGHPTTGFVPEGWTLQIVNVAGAMKAHVSNGISSTDMDINASLKPVVLGAADSGLRLSFDPDANWQEGESYLFASWFLELPSTTRSATQAFPAQAVLVATNNEVNLYDAADDTLWMKFARPTSGCTNSMVYGCNANLPAFDSLYGKIYLALNSEGVTVLSFASDTAYRYTADSLRGTYNGTVSNRNANAGFTLGSNTPIMNNNAVTDVVVKRIGSGTWVAAAGTQVQTLREGQSGTVWNTTAFRTHVLVWDESNTLWAAGAQGGSTTTTAQLSQFNPDLTSRVDHFKEGSPVGTAFLYKRMFLSHDIVYLASTRGVELFGRDAAFCNVARCTSNVPTLGGTSIDVRGLSGEDFRLFATTAGSGALTVVDTGTNMAAGSLSAPPLPSNDLSGVTEGATSTIPLNVVIGTNSAGAVRIKGDYHALAFTNDLIVKPGAQSPKSQLVPAGSELPVFQFVLNNGTGEGVHLNSVSLTASGNGNDTLDISQVTLHQDNNQNGTVDSNDILIGSGAYSSDDGTLTLPADIDLASGNSITLLVSYEWNDLANLGTNYSVSIADESAIEAVFEDLSPLSKLGLSHPMSSGVFTISNLPPASAIDSISGLLQSDRISAVYYYDAQAEPAGAAIDTNWRNGVIQTAGSISGTKSANVIVTGTHPTGDRIEIIVHGDQTFGYRVIQSNVTPVPAFTGSLPLSSAPTEIPGTGVSVTFQGTFWSDGDTFRIASWFTEPSGPDRGTARKFPDRAAVVLTPREIAVIDADSASLWMRFARATSCTPQHGMFPCNTNDVEATDVAIIGGRLVFAFGAGSALPGLYVVDFARDEAYALNSASKYFGSTTAGTPRANLRDRVSNFGYANQTAAPASFPNNVDDIAVYYRASASTPQVATYGSGSQAAVLRVNTGSTTLSSASAAGRAAIEFGPDGDLYYGAVSGANTILRRTAIGSYDAQNFAASNLATLNGASVTALKATDDIVYLGTTQGILLRQASTLAAPSTGPATYDVSSGQLVGSNSVEAVEACNGWLFAATNGSSGGINVISTQSHQHQVKYGADTGLPEDDVTSMSVGTSVSDFVSVAGTRNSGATILRGTLNDVVAFRGLKLQERNLFVTRALSQSTAIPLFWFDVTNDSGTPITFTSIALNRNGGLLQGSIARLYQDSDLNGALSEGDISWGTVPMGSSSNEMLAFTAPAGQSIAPHARIALLLVADFGLEETTSLQISFASNSNLIATQNGSPADVTGAPFSGNSIILYPRIRIFAPLSGDALVERSQIVVQVEAHNTINNVESIDITIPHVDPSTIVRIYNPDDPALDRTAEATLTLPLISENGGSQDLTITATVTDGAAQNSQSIPVTLLPTPPPDVTWLTPSQEPLERGAQIYLMAKATGTTFPISDFYFTVNGSRVDALPAPSQEGLQYFVAPITVPDTATVELEAVAADSRGAATHVPSSHPGVRRPADFRAIYSIPGDTERSVLFTNSWSSPNITVRFSKLIDPTQDFTALVELEENGSTVPRTIVVNGNELHIAAQRSASSTDVLTVRNVRSTDGDVQDQDLVATFQTAAQIIYTDDDAGGAAPCGATTTAPCGSLQSAVSTSIPGTTILLAPGNYTTTNAQFTNDGISIEGADPSVEINGDFAHGSSTDGGGSWAFRNFHLNGAMEIHNPDRFVASNLRVSVPPFREGIIVDGIDDVRITSNDFICEDFGGAFSVIGLIAGNTVNCEGGISTGGTTDHNWIDALTSSFGGSVISNTFVNTHGSTAVGATVLSGYVARNQFENHADTSLNSNDSFISDNELVQFNTSAFFGSGILYRNVFHDSGANGAGIILQSGQFLENTIIHSESSGILIGGAAVAAGNIFRNLGPSCVEQSNFDPVFYESNRFEACSGGAIVQSGLADFGGGQLGSRGGNFFLGNTSNLTNNSGFVVDARNNTWDAAPPAKITGDVNATPFSVLNPESIEPVIAITEPQDGAFVSSTQDLIVRIEANDDTAVRSVGAKLDAGDLIYNSIQPYDIVVPAANLTLGSHTITVEVRDVWNNVTTDSITVDAQ